MADAQLARNVARPDPVVGQLDDPLPDQVGQGPPIDEDSAELVYSTVTCYCFFLGEIFVLWEKNDNNDKTNGEEVSISMVVVGWRG